MKAPYYIVSDNHFMMNNTQSEIDRRKKLFEVFEKIIQKGEGTLIIGGDFFDFWFETKHAIPKGYESIIKALKKLHNSGIEIHYIAGNHDYWDFGYLSKITGLIFHKNDLMFNNNKVLITHGDGILKNDRGYRFMKKIIRSKLFINLFKLIPHEISFKFANKMSKSSANYNHHDSYVDTIINDVSEYAENKWNQNIDTVLVGHYHQQKIITKNGKKLVFLGDWLGKFTVTLIDKKKLWQGDWKQFLELT